MGTIISLPRPIGSNALCEGKARNGVHRRFTLRRVRRHCAPTSAPTRAKIKFWSGRWERATERPEYAVAIGDQAELCFKFTELKRSFAASGNLPDHNRRAQNWTRAPE